MTNPGGSNMGPGYQWFGPQGPSMMNHQRIDFHHNQTPASQDKPFRASPPEAAHYHNHHAHMPPHYTPGMRRFGATMDPRRMHSMHHQGMYYYHPHHYHGHHHHGHGHGTPMNHAFAGVPQQYDNRQYHRKEGSPRSPSPPGIPPPPKSVPSSAPPKLSNEKKKSSVGSGPTTQTGPNSASRRLSLEEAFGGPLRVSQRQNSLCPVSEEADTACKETTPKAAEKETKAGEEDKPKNKTPSVQEASLLLGLRTNSQSPDSKEEGGPKSPEQQGEETTSPDAAGSAATPIFAPKTFVMPQNYPTRLNLPTDALHLNTLHCYLRAELLELFVIPPSDRTSNIMAGRVGFQCIHCARKRPFDPKRENEATMAVFYPKSVREIYRLVTNWTRCHVRKCRNLPPDVRKKWDELRANEKSRGKTHYWAESAKEIGLVSCNQSRAGGVRFRADMYKGASEDQENNNENDDTEMAVAKEETSGANEDDDHDEPAMP